MSDAASPTKDVPLSKQLNVPPVWLAVTILVSYLWSKLLPIYKFGGMWSDVIGAILIVAGLALAIWSILAFQEHETPVHPRRKPTTLLTTGPYARSRNPIYLAMVGIAEGAAFCMGTIGAFIPVIGFIWIILDLFIKPEEHHIEKNFGDEYKAYAGQTRRWL